MFKLIKYLKGSVGAVLVIIALLIVQAFCDLSLPDYTSSIVNVGIQQGGVEDAVPTVIRESELNKILLFVSPEDKNEILDDYTLLSKNTLTPDELKDLEEEYQDLANEPLYELNDLDTAKRNDLNQIISKPIVIVSTLEAQENSAQMFKAISMMPQEQFEKQFSEINEKFKDMPDSMIIQAATSYVKAEYKTIGIDTDAMQITYILTIGAKMIGIALVSMAAAVVVGYIGARVAAKIARNLRGQLFGKVLQFSNEEMEKFSTASLITRSTNDIQQIQMFIVIFLKIVIYAPILGIGGVYKVFQTDVSMSWIIALAVVVIFAVILVLFSAVMPKFKVIQKYVDRLNLVTREIVTGIPVIRAFSTQKHEYERFEVANKDLTKTNLFVNRVMAGMMPTMMLIMNGITVLIVWNGGKAVDAGSMQVGDMMAFIQYAMQIIMAFLMLSMISILLPRAAVSAGRVNEVLDTDVVIKDTDSPKKFIDAKKGYVEFKNVSFKYPDGDENVIENVSFTAKPGETTAFIGSTGSGKSTLINLIPRFYDATEGEILVDGVNIKDVSQHDLRDRIGYVPQKGILFSGTIESNLKYGKNDATEAEVEKAARIAQATEFIESKPEKYESPIAQGGTNVSGGQKQRLSIARAVAKEPEIYIFDDSFSALDYKTDATLRKALKKETGDSTVLIVAQRISTILHAEQIIVLDEGKVVGKGTHKELLKTCEVYKEIAESQLSKEELENE
ncbi:ATP-binding cassette, subfamily B [Clostridium sp. DSM 8431]|uniref:ABC transporter ATP-binding protein n=1 Tax=Clostridium sp. DSM 8431 TaxID=1761781 RepID=UPI0008ECBC04|nr:ABC transporter ATP-binding protein [Clostridium sp. DSM 8431]SFU65674.1 ATP-binding cassette, subfamily B [Clostridium sp. DSM 8431]